MQKENESIININKKTLIGISSLLFAIMIYMFVLLFSTEDDDSNLRIAQKMCER